MPVVSTAKMTARQFAELGEDPPGVRLELVNGEVAVSPSPTPEHSNVDTRLRSLLLRHADERKLGLILADVDTVFGEHDVRRPDILFFATDRLHLVGRKKLSGPPDLCVEIVSPSSSTVDLVDKFQQYEAGGVPHYWVLDPEPRSIKAYQLRRGKYVLAGEGQGSQIVRLPPFPKLDIPLDGLWLPDFSAGRKRPRRKQFNAAAQRPK